MRVLVGDEEEAMEHLGVSTHPLVAMVRNVCWRRWLGGRRRQQRMVVEAFGGEARRARRGSRNTKARLVGTEEARSGGSEPCSVVAMVELDVPTRTLHGARGRARESESK